MRSFCCLLIALAIYATEAVAQDTGSQTQQTSSNKERVVGVLEGLKMLDIVEREKFSLPPSQHRSWTVTANKGEALALRGEIEPNWVSPPQLAFCTSEGMAEFLQKKSLHESCVTEQMNATSDSLEVELNESGTFHAVVLNGRFALNRTISITLEVERAFDKSSYRSIRNNLQNIDNTLKAVFKDFKFIWVIDFCNANASYNPQNGMIKVCSGFLEELARTRPLRESVLQNVLMHEVGHGLLHQWGLPGYSVEELADEMGAVLLILLLADDGQQQVATNEIGNAVRYWRENAKNDEGTTEFLSRVQSPHPLAVQRGRKLATIAGNPGFYVGRWIKLLRPFIKEEVLARIAGGKVAFIDPSIAQEILADGETEDRQFSQRAKIQDLHANINFDLYAGFSPAKVVSHDVQKWLSGLNDRSKAEQVSNQPLLLALIHDYFDSVGEPEAFQHAVNTGKPLCLSACRELGAEKVDVGETITSADFVRMMMTTKYGFVEESSRRWTALRRINDILAEMDIDQIELTVEDRAYFSGPFRDLIKRSTALSGQQYPNIDRLISRSQDPTVN